MQPILYAPKRRFIPSKQAIYKAAFVIGAVLSLALNWYLWRSNYVVRCGNTMSDDMKYMGSFMSKERCEGLVQNWIDSTELVREQTINNKN